MSLPAKAAMLVFVFAVCALGVVFVPTETTQQEERTVPVVPVNNHQPKRHSWLRV